MKTQTKKWIKITAIVLASIIGAAILVVGGYVLFVVAKYYRIPDETDLELNGSAANKVSLNVDYSLMTYNLGFGAYSPDYTFFMDEGKMNDGTKTVGVYGKGISHADVDKNVTGQVQVAKNVGADFYFFQEVDIAADRSYHIDMYQRIADGFAQYTNTYASNFHTPKLLYPFNDPIGKTEAGLMTLASYKVESAVRRQFPLSDKLISNLFDLDRCFAVHYLPIEGSSHYLVLINLHMSAYDEGGTVRAAQLKMLNEVLAKELEAGNYVIAGGDFNHCLIADNFASDAEALQYFPSQQQTPDWVKNSVLHNRELATGFSIAAPLNASTCRGADMTYQKDVTYTTVIDGFIVSNNVEVVSVLTQTIEYAYSDHNPVVLHFVLKSE